MEVRICCAECGFLNTDVRNECKACLSQLRIGTSSKKLKKKIILLEKNKFAIQKIIHQIKKNGKEYPFQDDETTDLLKQVLKKNLTSEKLALEKDLHHTKRTIVRLRQDLEKIYAKERTFRNKSSSMSLFKFLEEKEKQYRNEGSTKTI